MGTSFTEFGKALNQASTKEDLQSVLNLLLEKGPSALDIEIRSLGPEGGGTLDSLSQFLSMLQVGFRHNTNFEALQSYLSLFLKIHAPVISQEGKFKASLE